MIDKFVKETFLKLTSKTYPYGYETELLRFLPKEIKPDNYGNYYLKIGNSETVFACHLDTACKDQVDVVHEFHEANNIEYVATDSKSILGADDKAGVTVILWMIQNKIPGLYYFFTGEEVGCIGSGAASKDYNFKNYKQIISFDRKDTCSVITHQSYIRTCSDAFADFLVAELNKNGLEYQSDDTGVYTDSAEFTKIIPECTNISVGYYKEHTFYEHQNITHLIALCKAVIKIKWESLPTSRDVNSTEWKSWDNWNGYGYGYVEEDDIPKWKKTRRSKKKSKGIYGGQFEEQFESEKTFYESFDNQMVRTGKDKYFVKNNYREPEDFSDFYSNKKEYYFLLKNKFLTTDLTKEDIRIIKEQYGYDVTI